MGNGDAAGAATAAAAARFFATGRPLRRTGVAGGNSATIGLGSTTVRAGLEKSPGMRVTVTGTVTGCDLGAENVTVKAFSASTSREQGVLQPGPTEVTASAPGGTESSWTVTGVGAGLNASMENDAQPLSAALAMTTRTTRRITQPTR